MTLHGTRLRWRAGFVWQVVLGAAVAAWGQSACAQIVTPLASYEPTEVDLTVTPGGADTGLTVTMLQGGTAGAPLATDGDYLLKVDFSGEDGKVEFRHDWSASTYDLAGQEQLLADVYIATASAMPAVMGIWSTNWSPPDNWQSGTGLPVATGVWTTISMDVSTRSQIGLNQIWAVVFEGMPGATGTAYVDNLRLVQPGGTTQATGLVAIGFADRNELLWDRVSDAGLDGYHVYRSDAPGNPFVQLTPVPQADNSFVELGVAPGGAYHYLVTAVIDGVETDPTNTVSVQYNGMTDDDLMTMVQEATFDYFWDFAHPVSKLTREGFRHASNITASGGTGMGLMAIVVGVERGFVTRAAAAQRILEMLTFLDESTVRYHGAWSHWIDGNTGATIAFAGPQDNGGDLVETAYLCQGFLTVRQYFDDTVDPVETEIRNRATSMWEGVEWDWYRRFAGSDVLYWHWSPDFGWALNMTVTGYNEAMIVYLLAMASPTHFMPASSYLGGWAAPAGYANGSFYFGIEQPVGPPVGGPLFFTHYSFLGFDPRYKQDGFTDYFVNSRNISLIHQAYADANPLNFEGYNAWMWGLTASTSPPPWDYLAHSPLNDVGTISPTAALSAMPFVPSESLKSTRYLYDTFGPALFSTYGFLDAINLQENWISDTFLAIDQGPIIVMIENYRSALCWNLFMANPEIRPAILAAGWTLSSDFDNDGLIELDDHAVFAGCLAGPGIGTPQVGCTQAQHDEADLDKDGDVDLCDTAVFDRLFDVP